VKADKEQNALLSRVYKQLLKEKRSGLFHNEQVFCLCSVKLRVAQCSERVLFTFRAVCIVCDLNFSSIVYMTLTKRDHPVTLELNKHR
jgi:hypothetical protein